MPAHTARPGTRRYTTASTTGVRTTYRPVTNAEVDADVYWSPTVWVAYPPKRSRPATTPTRQSRRRSCMRRAAIHAAGATKSTAMPKRPTRYANGVMSSSASWTSGNVMP
jgi:hypothetical protein